MLNLYLDFHDIPKIRVKFNGVCLQQDHSRQPFHDGIINFLLFMKLAIILMQVIIQH